METAAGSLALVGSGPPRKAEIGERVHDLVGDV